MWRRAKKASHRSELEKALEGTEGRIKLKDIEHIKRLYDSGEVKKALRLAEKTAAKSYTDAWGIFLRLAHNANDLDEKAFWTVCASFAAAVPLHFLPIDDWFESLAHLAYGIAAGYVDWFYSRLRPRGQRFLFALVNSFELKTIADVKTVKAGRAQG
jgi:hypothetical protein